MRAHIVYNILCLATALMAITMDGPFILIDNSYILKRINTCYRLCKCSCLTEGNQPGGCVCVWGGG